MAAVALGVALAGGTVQWSTAQRYDSPRISVAPTIQVVPASQARLPIEVEPTDGLPRNSFLRLRGFPTSVSLTEGHAIAPGAWAIPLFGLPSLRAIVPAGVTGRAEIVITLVGVDGHTLAETRTALVIAAPVPIERETVPESRPPVTSLPPVRKVAPPPGLSDEARAHAERMLAHGTRHLEQGNISAARMFFQNAADAGLAEAALKLGSTYDPAELPRLGAPNTLAGDAKEARRWYEKARDLGAAEADSRLGRLGGR